MAIIFLALAGICALVCWGIVGLMSQHPTGGTDFPMGIFTTLFLGVPVFLLLALVAWLHGVLT